MARKIPSDRFDSLVRAATEVFIARGFRLTQMSDVAEAVGVAKGTLYGYVESKDALLLLCLDQGDDTTAVDVPEGLPIAAPPTGAVGQLVKAALAEEIQLPRLMAALKTSRPADTRIEVSEIVGEFYDLMSANRHRIKLLDRCMDHPELKGLWQDAGREQTRALFIRYLEKRIETGDLRAQADLRLAARMIVETCATWAVHIHWDRSPEPFAPEALRANAIDFLVRGLLA